MSGKFYTLATLTANDKVQPVNGTKYSLNEAVSEALKRGEVDTVYIMEATAYTAQPKLPVMLRQTT